MTSPDDNANPVAGRLGRRRQFRRAAAIVAGLLLLLLARPGWHLLSTAWNDRDELRAVPPGEVNDASRLNQTAVADIVDVPIDLDRAEEQLAELLNRARREGLRVSIAGARHSMGGHTIYPGGISINMLPLNGMEL
ncbi:MAG: hypothetical protein VB876_19215, partial [Pirellulales bacterium]